MRSYCRSTLTQATESNNMVLSELLATACYHTYLNVILPLMQKPFLIFTIVALLSLSYNHTKHIKLFTGARQRIINFHALATEACQLLLLVFAFTNTAAVIDATLEVALVHRLSGKEEAYLVEATVLLSLALHAAAVYAVDVVEARILLEEWRHPYNWRPFVITLSWLQSRRSRQRPARQAMVRKKYVDAAVQTDMDARERLAEVQYLDLAIARSPRRTPRKRTPIRSTQNYDPKSALVASLPTPPRSNDSKPKNRVKWVPTIIVTSSTGQERRTSVS